MKQIKAHKAETMVAFFKGVLEKDSQMATGSIYEWRDADQDINAYDYGDNYEMPIALMKNLKDEGFVKDETLTKDFEFNGFKLTMTVWKMEKSLADWLDPFSLFVAGYMKGASERVLIEFRNLKK